MYRAVIIDRFYFSD